MQAVPDWDRPPDHWCPLYLRRPDAQDLPSAVCDDDRDTPVVYDELTRRDAARCAELEAHCSGDDPWPGSFRPRTRRRPQPLRAPRVDDTLVGYAGAAQLGRTPPFEFEIHTIGVDPDISAALGIGRGMLSRLLGLRRPGVVVYLEIPDRQRGGNLPVPQRRFRRCWECASATTAAGPTPSGCGGSGMKTVLAIETSCDETGSRHRRAGRRRYRHAAGRRGGLQRRRTRPFRRRGARVASRAHLGRSAPLCAARCRPRGSNARHRRRHDRPRSGRCAAWSGWPRRRHTPQPGTPFYAVNHPRRPPAADVYDHGPLPESVACWCPAATPTCCMCVRCPSPSSNSAAPWTTPPAGHDKGGPPAGPGLSGRSSVLDDWPAPATRTRSSFPGDDRSAGRALCLSFSGLKTAVARYVESHPRPIPPTSPPAFRVGRRCADRQGRAGGR